MVTWWQKWNVEGANKNMNAEVCALCPLWHNSVRVLTCFASPGSGWCICSALLPLCAPAAADWRCSPTPIRDRLLLRPSRPGSRSRSPGCATRPVRASSTQRSTRKSWFCSSRDADYWVPCPSWRRDGGEQEERRWRGRGGGRDGGTRGSNSGDEFNSA